MNVPDINEVKAHLDKLKSNGMVSSWELPYENLLTRRSAAIFFFDSDHADKVAVELSRYADFSYRENTEKKLSKYKYRVTFSKEEREKNENAGKEVKVEQT